MAASPSTISASGTQTFSFNNQTANTLLAGPSSGSAATPTFRALVNADFPNTLAPTIAVTNMTGTGAFSTSGNAGTATALAAAPTACTLPQVALGVAASGNASCSEPSNVTGTAANLSGTPALPNGATATTQSTGDGTAKLATDAFVDASLVANPISINGTSCALGGSCSPVVPVTIVSTSTVTLGGSYSVGIAYNENATASQAVTATLPTPVAGKVFCIKNFYNGVSPNTGTLELLVANTSTQYIVFNGAISSSGYVISSGASGDYGCVTGVDSLHWDFTPSVGTWVLH
jgi:hypothetical protein